MKLFLTSASLPGRLPRAFSELVGKPMAEIQLAHVLDAAFPYPEERRGFLYRTRNELAATEIGVSDVSLSSFDGNPEGLLTALSGYDAVWLAGGNTFYLRYWLRRSGFEGIAAALIDRDVVLAGGSAGALVLGGELRPYAHVDDPAAAPELIQEGLGLYGFSLVPHWGTEKFQPALDKVAGDLRDLGRDVVTITDGQAVIVRDGAWETVTG